MLPTRVRTISTATTSLLAMVPSDWWASTNNTSRGSEAPAYVRSSVLTIDAMWSRPTLIAPRKRPFRSSEGFASWSSHTVDACVIVTSSKAPAAPSTIPASRSPLTSTPSKNVSNDVSSTANPVNRAAATTMAESKAVRTRAAVIPMRAIVVIRLMPWARYIAT